jgi:hypothetical protein
MAHFERVKQALEVCDFTSDDIQVWWLFKNFIRPENFLCEFVFD